MVVDDIERKRQQLIKLLQKGGYQYEILKKGDILIPYLKKLFMVYFEESPLGKRYARITIINLYQLDITGKVHPSIVHTIMIHSTNTNPQTPSLAYSDHCISYYSTDVIYIKDLYCNLKSIFNILIDSQNEVINNSKRILHRCERRKDSSEKGLNGFQPSSSDGQEVQY